METVRSVSIETVDQYLSKGALSLDDTLACSAGIVGDTFGFSTRGDFINIRGFDAPGYRDGMQSLSGNYNNTRPEITNGLDTEDKIVGIYIHDEISIGNWIFNAGVRFKAVLYWPYFHYLNRITQTLDLSSSVMAYKYAVCLNIVVIYVTCDPNIPLITGF